jgi:hypothetical protein
VTREGGVADRGPDLTVEAVLPARGPRAGVRRLAQAAHHVVLLETRRGVQDRVEDQVRVVRLPFAQLELGEGLPPLPRAGVRQLDGGRTAVAARDDQRSRR